MFKNVKLFGMMLLVAAMVFSGCSSTDEPVDTIVAEEVQPESVENADASAEVTESEVETAEKVILDLDYTTGLDVNGFYENVVAKELVENLDVSAIAIPAEVHVVSDETLQAEIDNLLAGFMTSTEVTDRAIVDGDTVNIDFVGSVDGVEFEGGSTSGAGTEVIIGETNYIDDFIQQLIGHTPGESFDIEVTFPEDYGVDTLNGKEAIFAITLNYINESMTPELTDAFVQENLSVAYEWATVDEMKAGMTTGISEMAVMNYVQTDFIENVVVTSIPEEVLDYQKNSMMNYYQSTAASYGVTMNEFLTSYFGLTTVDELFESAAQDLEDMSNYSLIMQAIAEEAELTVTEDLLSEYFVNVNGTGDYAEFEGIYGIEFLKYTVLQQVVLDYLVEQAELL